MCSLFGLIDYGNCLSHKQRTSIISTLSRACEVRGTDATGIAYCSNGKLHIYKRAKPAHKMKFHFPSNANAIMGHTRMTTQGDEKYNQNNHPFLGYNNQTSFALAHNGVIQNDQELRKKWNLPQTTIETDSYIAIQLLERFGDLSFENMRKMAELLHGTSIFTLLDDHQNCYFIKGNNPISIFHWAELGVYIYASTEEILKSAIISPFSLGKSEHISIKMGEIAKIDKQGILTKHVFSTSHLETSIFMTSYDPWHCLHSKRIISTESNYIQTLKRMAGIYGFTANDIDLMLAEGISPEEIENYFYFEDAFTY